MDEEHLRFAFVGDVCLPFLKGLPNGDPEFTYWSAIKNEIGEHDFLVGNLECCLVDERCSAEARRKSMATPVTAVSFLREIGFSDLSLANNHSMDCGVESITATRECLASNNIRAFGAGLDMRAAEAPVFAERNGYKVAILGACDQSEFYASGNGAGIAPIVKSRLGKHVREAAEHADLVVTILHADLEFSEVPGRWRQRLSRWLVEQGSQLVIQHHPHVLQGIEEYKGGLIAYSLGNFIFRLRGNKYQERQDGVFDSMVLAVDVDMRGSKPTLTHRIIPLEIGSDHLPHLLPVELREKAVGQLNNLSYLVAERNLHRKAWFRRCRSEAASRLLDIYYAFRRGDISGAKRMLHKLLTCREDRHWMRGLASLGYL